jgi:hypothetical protein
VLIGSEERDGPVLHGGFGLVRLLELLHHGIPGALAHPHVIDEVGGHLIFAVGLLHFVNGLILIQRLAGFFDGIGDRLPGGDDRLAPGLDFRDLREAGLLEFQGVHHAFAIGDAEGVVGIHDGLFVFELLLAAPGGVQE